MKTKPYPNAAGSMSDHAGSMRNHAKSMGHHARALAVTLVLFASACPPCVFSARGQPLIQTSVSHFLTEPVEFGRDFWLAEMSNMWGESEIGTKALRLFIVSANNTTAYVEVNGKVTPIAVSAYTMRSYTLPEFVEMESSGFVTNKAVHVWSNDADLTVYNLSDNGWGLTEGEQIIPAVGWGTDYVVAAGRSFYAGSGSYVYDLPSLMAIVADEDNTLVTITPSCDVRGPQNHPAGSPITVTLNRGQSYQLMSVQPVDSGLDLTGTIVHATKPVGVFGGSMESDIPTNFPYPNRLEEMMLPVSRWGTKYFGSSFHQTVNAPIASDSALYLLVASKADQTITVHQCVQSDDQHFTIGTQYGIIWTEQFLAATFSSDAPFECVEYSNSSLYPDSISGSILPSETVLMPRESFSNTVLCVAPSSGEAFYSYAAIVLHDFDENHILFDGHPLAVYPPQCLDTTWELYVVNNVSPGLHEVTGADSGTSVTVYGYREGSTYSWTGSSNLGSFIIVDTIPPQVHVSGSCLNARVHLSDSGSGNAGLWAIRIDSQSNMAFVLDSNFISGSNADTSGYSMDVFDPSQPATLLVHVFDAGGNETAITSIYTPLNIRPFLQNLGTQAHSGTPNRAFDTIVNTGTVPLSLSGLHLISGTRGFTLHDSVGGALDTTSIPPGHWRRIEIQYLSNTDSTATDTLALGNGCLGAVATVIGAGGNNDFYVTDQVWSLEQESAPDTGYIEALEIDNLSADTIRVDSGTWNDNTHFKFARHANGTPYNTFPIVLPPAPASSPVYIAFFPDAESLIRTDTTRATWTSPDVLAGGVPVPHFNVLTGGAGLSSAVFGTDTIINDTCGEPGTVISIPLTINAIGSVPFRISQVKQSSPYFNALQGTITGGVTWNPASSSQSLLPGQSATILVQYTVPGTNDYTAIDTLFAFDSGSNPIPGSPVIVTINGVYREFSSQPTVNMGTVPFGAQPDTQSFELMNNGSSPLTMQGLDFQETKYAPAFSLSSVPPCPAVLQPGTSMTITIVYNDTLFSDPFQQVALDYESDACNYYQTTVNIQVGNLGVAEAKSLAANVEPLDAQTVRIAIAGAAPAVFELFNVLGEIVYSGTIYGTEAVNTGALRRGMYFYRLTTSIAGKSGQILLGN